tara:strand:+ start:10791 stop:14894 length:4104 start_codon:yes stop_codon:yes gene_type:complete
MNKEVKYTFGGMTQDITKSKHPFQLYYDAEHIRILSTDTQATGSVSNEKGNALVITIPTVSIDTINSTITWKSTPTTTEVLDYTTTEILSQVSAGLLPIESTTQAIIGTTPTRDGIIIFTSDGLGMDCIWEVDDVLGDNYVLTLLYVRNLGLSINNPVQSIFNYENAVIQKIYWVDGKNQLRFLNTRHSIANEDLEELIDINSNTINFVGNFDLSQPTIDSVNSGGNHTAGMIQYAYNLYRLNASQTTISPLSDLIPLDKGGNQGGGEVNEVVGATPIVRIANIDPDYTHIKVYAIKYTSLNQIPQISLIVNREVGGTSDIVYFDDGTVISDLTLEEFLFLGSNPIIPRHIETKDNILFSANITENNFDVDIDCRAYGYISNSSTAIVLNNVTAIVGTLPITGAIPTVGGDTTIIPADFTLEEKNDAVNPNMDFYKYQRNNTTLGGTGKYIKYSVEPSGALTAEEIENGQFFKSREIYRIGIQFHNNLGQKSFPKWVADFKAPTGNLDSTYNTLTVELTTEFYVWLNDSSNFNSEEEKPIGYKIIRADRGLNDRSILYQGALSSMLFQVKGAEAQNVGQFPGAAGTFQDSNIKFPTYITRSFNDSLALGDDTELGTALSPGKDLNALDHLGWTTGAEIHSVTATGEKISQTFQHTKMMQLHSPEVMYDFATIKEGLNIKLVGLATRTYEAVQSKETYITTELEKNGGKFEFYPTRQFFENNGMNSCFTTPNGPDNPVFIGPSGDSNTIDIFQYYKEFHGFTAVNSGDGEVEYPIYGKPELSVRGDSTRDYNGDGRYQYANNLRSFTSDGEDDCADCDALVSINSFGAKCLTIMMGTNGQDTDDRWGIVSMRQNAVFGAEGGAGGDAIMIVDVSIPNENIYLGNIYGGGSFEAKRRNTYIEIGEYTAINTTSVFIKSPGDTFINTYKLLRVGKTDTSTLDTAIPQFSDIVSFPVETTVDLKNRNDLSLFEWDNRFQPAFDDYHKYNRVYTQKPTLVQNTAEGFNFKKVDSFDTRVLASKVKIPGEDIDNWTDLLINESNDLDGKYGPINGLINFKDNLYTFQDEAIAGLSINPRVQVQGSDGIAVELGTGGVFYDYNYLTTTSGSINKWGIVSTKKGIYYYDALNKAVGRVPGNFDTFLSDAKGMHTWFNNNYDYSKLKVDNPLLGSGVAFGYDNYNNDVYFTLLQGFVDKGDKKEQISFTRVYNELLDQFIDKKIYLPSGYIYKGEKLLLTHPSNNTIYEQFAGNYNEFFGKLSPSTITLMLNPESDYDCIFNNIQFKSELYIDDIDQPDKTLTHIQAYNEYQNSGKIPLEVGRGKNIRRKFREWKADIPRQGRERIRNTWIFLKLEYNNDRNGKLILHDIILSYTL